MVDELVICRSKITYTAIFYVLLINLPIVISGCLSIIAKVIISSYAMREISILHLKKCTDCFITKNGILQTLIMLDQNIVILCFYMVYIPIFALAHNANFAFWLGLQYSTYYLGILSIMSEIVVRNCCSSMLCVAAASA